MLKNNRARRQSQSFSKNQPTKPPTKKSNGIKPQKTENIHFKIQIEIGKPENHSSLRLHRNYNDVLPKPTAKQKICAFSKLMKKAGGAKFENLRKNEKNNKKHILPPHDADGKGNPNNERAIQATKKSPSISPAFSSIVLALVDNTFYKTVGASRLLGGMEESMVQRGRRG